VLVEHPRSTGTMFNLKLDLCLKSSPGLTTDCQVSQCLSGIVSDTGDAGDVCLPAEADTSYILYIQLTRHCIQLTEAPAESDNILNITNNLPCQCQ
jgi:hypothetical protein